MPLATSGELGLNIRALAHNLSLDVNQRDTNSNSTTAFSYRTVYTAIREDRATWMRLPTPRKRSVVPYATAPGCDLPGFRPAFPVLELCTITRQLRPTSSMERFS